MIREELINDLFKLMMNSAKIEDEEIRTEFLRTAIITLKTYLESNGIIKSGEEKLLKECLRWGIRSNEMVLSKEQQKRLKNKLFFMNDNE